jgi:CHAT domain-containing protein/Tfp pilus assembly protein PilF
MQRFKLKLRFLLLSFIVLMASCTSNPPMPSLDKQANAFMVKGQNQFERGQWVSAIAYWQQAADLFQQIDKVDLSIKALLKLAEGYQRLGHYQEAQSTLKTALMQANNSGDGRQKATVLGSLGQLCYAMGQVKKAQEYLEKSIQLAKQIKQPVLQAWGLLHFGPVLAAQQNYHRAQTQLTQSIQLAQQQNKTSLALKGLMNKVSIELQMGDEQKAQTSLVSLWTQLRRFPDSHEKAYLLLKLSQLVEQFNSKIPPNLPFSKGGMAVQLPDLASILTEVIRIAQTIGDQYALSQAAGQLGYLYEQAKRYDEALELTRLAHASAEQVNGKRLLYRWDWQRGRVLKAQGNLDAAIIAYQSAKQALDKLKLASQDSMEDCQTLTHSPNFKTVIEPLFLGLADLLLQRAKHSPNPKEILKEARQVVESLKETEIQDYFESQCATELLGEARHVDDIGEKTAVLYPIVFENRLELLLSLPDGNIEQFSQPVTKQRFKKAVKFLRTELEKTQLSKDYLDTTKQLDEWLIQPIVATLEKYQINTLVVVPRDSLLTIPFAVFYDGKQFLIERYALAITTGVRLTAPNANTLADKNVPVLSTGLTQVTPELKKTYQYQALQFAGSELKEMQKLYPNKNHHQLEGTRFTNGKLEDALEQKPYRLLHISSHAQFARDFKKTFVLTYNQELMMDKLAKIIKSSKYRKDEPLELLTLNACQTAKGDERAALGLSGIALKAGARSALATLWNVDEEVAIHLTQKFYQHIQSGLSKAQALQKALTEFLLIDNPKFKYQHPHYWAAFILIGNWL